MPLHAMEKYSYPTLRVMQYLHSAKGMGRFKQLPGADRAQAQEEREENADRHID